MPSMNDGGQSLAENSHGTAARFRVVENLTKRPMWTLSTNWSAGPIERPCLGTESRNYAMQTRASQQEKTKATESQYLFTFREAAVAPSTDGSGPVLDEWSPTRKLLLQLARGRLWLSGIIFADSVSMSALEIIHSSRQNVQALGHVSIQITERYLGCKQRVRSAVNDRIGIEPVH
jgi:hypothetical protein